MDRDWIPQQEGTSLYVRPFIYRRFPGAGRRAGTPIISSALFFAPLVLTMPMVWHLQKFTWKKNSSGRCREERDLPKSAATMRQLSNLRKKPAKGYDQVLWLDGVERKYVEEIGTSNAFFVINDEVITAPWPEPSCRASPEIRY